MGQRTRKIDPIPYEPRAGESEEFEVRLTAEQFESLKDTSGDIRFERVVKYLLPVVAMSSLNGLLDECAITCNI